MPLYSVRLTNEIVVMASDEEEAQTLARTHEPDEKRHARTEALGVVRTADDLKRLAPQWDTGCIPYGRKDDATIGEIIGERVPSGIMAEPLA
jgi:hypothetical protein